MELESSGKGHSRGVLGAQVRMAELKLKGRIVNGLICHVKDFGLYFCRK